MIPSPQDDSLTSSPDGNISLTHSMIRDISTASMDSSVSPSSPVSSRTSNNIQCSEASVYSPQNSHAQMPQPHQQSTVNNNYMISNNNTIQTPVSSQMEYMGHHSPQMMVPQAVDNFGSQNFGVMGGLYGQLEGGQRIQRTSPQPPPPMMNNNNNVHKISVKCAAELIHAPGDLAHTGNGGLRTSFKKEPDHRY